MSSFVDQALLSGSMSTNFKIGGSPDKLKMMKQFNVTVMDYLHIKSDISSAEINKHLMQIVSDMDLTGFDPQNDVTAEFYVNLSELMNGFDMSSGGLVWCAVAVLERACHNSVARLSLIHTYRFIPVLAKLLLNVVGTDKKIRVLTLMQNLTYGIKITWQEPHLANVMNQLLQWVQSGNDQLATLSLSVMVNICYKNLSSTCILTRLVDAKVLIKTLVKLQNNNNSMQVYLWKMIMILENMTGETSDEDLLQFIQVSFAYIIDSFRNKDATSLRHTVDFFIDIRGQASTQKTMAEYKNFSNDLSNLLICVENNSTLVANEGNGDFSQSSEPLCMSMLFEFIHSILLLGLPEIQPLHPQLVVLALKWIQYESASSQALGVLRTIVEQSRSETPTSGLILKQLSEKSMFLLLSLEDQNILQNTPERITSVIQLVLSMTKQTSLIDKVLANIKQSSINIIFSTLMDGNEDRPNIDSVSQKHTDMYVNCLSLVAHLASLDCQQWRLYLIKLLRKPPVQSLIARAMCTGSLSLREQVMKLIQTRECEFPISEVCKILCELEPIVMTKKSFDQSPSSPGMNYGMPIMSVVQQSRLDKLINKFEEAAAQNQISNIVTSEVMELYEHKIAVISHAERNAHNSLESASNQITSLNHRLALMSNELERLRGMLYTTQLRHEKLTSEKNTTALRLAEIAVNLKETHYKYQTEKEKRVTTVNELKQKLDNTEIRLTSCLSDLQQVNLNYQQVLDEKKKLEHQNQELSTMLEKYEEKYKTCKLKVEEIEKALLQARKENKELKKELAGVTQIKNDHEIKLHDQEITIKRLTDEVKEMDQTRELISTLATRKKKEVL